MKKLFRKIGKGIKKLVSKVGEAFGKVMNKLGPLGMFAMMIAMPYVSNFWSTMGNAIGGTATGGQVAATAQASASATASASGATASQAANIGAEAGRQAAKEAAKEAGASALKASVKSSYASGTGQATGLFAGGTASKALGYTLKTLHNVASFGINAFSTLTGAVTDAIDFVSGGNLSKFGNWVGDRIGDFQTRLGLQTSPSYNTRLKERTVAGNVPKDIANVLSEKGQLQKWGVENQYNKEGVFIGDTPITSSEDQLITKNFPTEPLQDALDKGTLTADASGTPGPVAPADDTQKDISSLLDKSLSKEEAMLRRDEYVTILEKEGSLKALETAESLRNADFSKWGDAEAFNQSLKGPSLLDRSATSIKEFFVGGENVRFNPEYHTDPEGNIVLGVDNKAIPTGRYTRNVTTTDNVLERVSSKVGEEVYAAPENYVRSQAGAALKRAAGLTPEYITQYNVAAPLPGISFDPSTTAMPTEIPRSNNFVGVNAKYNTDNNSWSSNPFIIYDPNNIVPLDYGQGGIYGTATNV